MLNVYGSKQYTAVKTQMIRLNVSKVDKTFNYTLILHSKSASLDVKLSVSE